MSCLLVGIFHFIQDKELAGQLRCLQTFEDFAVAPAAPTNLTTHHASAQVCICLNVSEQAIKAHLHSDCSSQRLISLQSALKCCTKCSSCRPPQQRLVRAAPASADLFFRQVIGFPSLPRRRK